MKKYLLLCAGLLLTTLSFSLSAQDFLKGKILYFEKGCSISERSGSGFSFSLLGGLTSNSSLSLLTVERAIEQAADDDDIAMIFIRPDMVSVDMTAAEELRETLARFQKKGKPVICYGTDFDNGSYYLGSVGDRVFMHPGSDGFLTGLSSTQPYFKDLLDSLGIEMQLIRHGSYKSAGEPYIRSEMSPENREQYEVLLNSIWTPMVEAMAASRNIPADSLRSWIDGLALSTSQTWLDRGLVDGLKYRDEMEQYLCHLFGTKNPDKLKKVSLSDYCKSVKDKGSARIAVLYAEGEIARGGSEIAGERFAREIAKVRADSTVKAVVFRVNSPGGEVVAADMIRREIELLRKVKPVVASYGAYAASGGYLISAGADRIFVDNSTLTGSIGVFGQFLIYGPALKKVLHINLYSVGTNAHSDVGSGLRRFNEQEESWYQDNIDGIYETFVRVVSEGRGMTRDEVDAIAQGRVWSGSDAMRIGLADEKGTLMDAVRYTAAKVGLKKYKISAYPSKKGMLESLLLREDKSDVPLVRIREILPEGFSVVAKMPYMTIQY